MKNKSVFMAKQVALLVCICVLVTFLFSSWFVVSHRKHDCVGYECTTCIQIRYCEHILEKLNFAFYGIVFSVCFLTVVLSGILFEVTFWGERFNTPVKLKVRMNH